MKYRYLLSIMLFLFPLFAFATDSDVAITVYNNDLALVREERAIDFTKGVQDLRFVDVASKIDPTSVHFNSLSFPGSINILEQNYEYDLVGTDRLLEKYLNQKITVTLKQGNVFNGVLLSSMGGDVILQTPEKGVQILKSSSVETVQFPELPEGLVTEPTLMWLINCEKPGKHNAEVSYLTHGINWHAEYVAVSNEKDTELELNGWVSIDNQCGRTFENALLKLVAGDVHMTTTTSRRGGRTAKVMYAMEAAAPDFEEESFFEYHLYTLQRPATVQDRQMKQISLFAPANVKTDKIYTYNGQRDQKKVRVNLEFKNSQKSGLGIPLPKGKIRVYKKSSKGSQEFIGEDNIDHTPKDEKVRIYLGNAFDIVGERVVKSVKDIGRNSRQEQIEITLKNHKDEDVTITVIEQYWGDWMINSKLPAIKKKNARNLEFDVKVPANGQAYTEFTVLFK